MELLITYTNFLAENKPKIFIGVKMKSLNLIQMLLLLVSFLTLSSVSVYAHCDSMEGPVVKASQKALETGNINYVLVWVRAEDEQEIKSMFDNVNKIRTLSTEAKELADMYFFETVVRIHRMGEGVAYTGLKPASYAPAEGIAAADIAIETGSVDGILHQLEEDNHSNIIKYFNEVYQKKDYGISNLQAGREYVAAYVHFVHYIETLFQGDGDNLQHHHHHH